MWNRELYNTHISFQIQTTSIFSIYLNRIIGGWDAIDLIVFEVWRDLDFIYLFDNLIWYAIIN